MKMIGQVLKDLVKVIQAAIRLPFSLTVRLSGSNELTLKQILGNAAELEGFLLECEIYGKNGNEILERIHDSDAHLDFQDLIWRGQMRLLEMRLGYECIDPVCICQNDPRSGGVLTRKGHPELYRSLRILGER